MIRKIKPINFIVKVEDTLREGEAGYNPLLVGTREGLILDGEVVLPCLEKIGTIEQRSDPVAHTASVAPTQFVVGNIKDEAGNLLISDWFYERMGEEGTIFFEEKVKIFLVGKEEIEVGDDFEYVDVIEQIYIGVIKNFSITDLEDKYTFKIEDTGFKMRKSLFDRELGEYKYFGVSETLSDKQAYRMPLGFTISEYNDDGDKSYRIFFEGTCRLFFEGVMQMVYSPPVGEIGVEYLDDTWKEYVNESTLVLLEDVIVYFEIYDPIEDIIELLRNEIYKLNNVYPFMSSKNYYGIKRYQQPTIEEIEDIPVFNEDIFLKIPKKTIERLNVANQAVARWEYIYDKEKNETINYNINYEEVEFYLDVNSLAKFRELLPEQPKEFNFKGINATKTNIDPQAKVNSIVDAFFDRWSGTTVLLEALVPYERAIDISTGDYIGISHKAVVEWTGEFRGKRGIGLGDEDLITTAFMDTGDVWGGFIPGNTIGRDPITGDWLINTSSSEIVSRMFTGTADSIVTNRETIEEWLVEQGGIMWVK